MSIEKVNTYLASSVNTPFFYFVGDSRYQDVKEKLTELGSSIVRVSDYCRNDDKLPDIDGLFDQSNNCWREYKWQEDGSYRAWRVPCALWK